jgi:hypothetical protein
MDTVLGVSMAPTAVQIVLVEGENGDGVTVDQDNFEVTGEDEAATIGAADKVVAAILGTREGAAEGGYQLTSTGITWTDPIEAAALRDALAAHKVENVMLVSAFLAAAALAQAVGNEINYAHTALLFVEADTATLAIIDTADGSIADVHRHELPDDDDAAVAELATIISGVEQLQTRANGVFVVGAGINIPLIKPTLEAATSLPLSAPEEPETALARGAALASANAPLFVSTTAAQAWAQDPGTGVVDPFAITPGYFEVTADAESGAGLLAYSAVSDDFADGYTGEYTAATTLLDADGNEKKPFALLGSVLASIFIVGVAALVVSFAISIRPTAGVRPDPGHNVVAPATQAPAAAPAPAPAAPAPLPEAPVQVPEAPAPVPIPAAPAPIPYVPAPEAPAPAPLPVAPAPVPVAPAAPIPVPIPIPLPIFGGPFGPHPGGGFPGGGGGFPGPGGGHGGFGGGHGGGGFPGGGGHGGFGRR